MLGAISKALVQHRLESIKYPVTIIIRDADGNDLFNQRIPNKEEAIKRVVAFNKLVDSFAKE